MCAFERNLIMLQPKLALHRYTKLPQSFWLMAYAKETSKVRHNSNNLSPQQTQIVEMKNIGAYLFFLFFSAEKKKLHHFLSIYLLISYHIILSNSLLIYFLFLPFCHFECLHSFRVYPTNFFKKLLS